MRAITKRMKVGAMAERTLVTAKMSAMEMRVRLRPNLSVMGPMTMAPIMQPKSSELTPQPSCRSLSAKWSWTKGPAPEMMAMSKPNITEPSAATRLMSVL